ncbi:pyrroloquinoline quinone biosynthesis protein PqqE [Bartonella sp. HY761]|uniref:pyrroloquinoline quinone biosynthesis protein PqqE n=1 Tax=Bartonella sp. HY761 TaxID=2979330 RepID=UPI003FA3C7B3
MEIMNQTILPPISMLAELTYRCPLQCPYCSNPLELMKADRECDTDRWTALFNEAADMGLLQVHLSGGEPTLRKDLPQLVAALKARDIYSNLITAGVGGAEKQLPALVEAGLDHVQLSVQGTDSATTELIGHLKGGFEQKMKTAQKVRKLQLPLTINAPIHRHNIDQLDDYVKLALRLGAERLEIANVQYSGWALLNRGALMPKREDFERQMDMVAHLREALRGILNIDYVIPDYFADYPKPCMGGWARDAFVATPDCTILPCHAAMTIKTLQFDQFGEKSLNDIWLHSSAFNAYRGDDWMSEPCRSCERKELDYGGCRCQALALAGNANEIDPACIRSPLHQQMVELGLKASQSNDELQYRRIGVF